MARALHGRRRRRAVAMVVFASILATSCTGTGDDPVATVPTTTTVPPVPRVDDGVLRIGALIPVSDPAIGEALATSFESAVDDINAAGGVLGQDVEVLTEDEGETSTTAAQATGLLVERGADAIIGPTSSNNAIGALDESTAAGIVSCSATASAMSLDDFADDGLFFRTIATDSLQAVAIAREARGGGADRAAIIHVDDAYGRPYADAVSDALSDPPSIEVDAVAVPVGDDDLDDDLDQFAAIGADTGIVLGSGDDIARFLEALGTRDDIDVGRIIVNDAARSAQNRQVIADLSPGFRNRIVGMAPQIVLPPGAGNDDNPPFASQVTDCVNLIALAAAQGTSDSPEVIAGQMTSVSSGGGDCRTFAACIELLDNDEEIDYDGPTSITELAREGDPSRAFFDLFGFLEDGASVYRDSEAVS